MSISIAADASVSIAEERASFACVVSRMEDPAHTLYVAAWGDVQESWRDRILHVIHLGVRAG